MRLMVVCRRVIVDLVSATAPSSSLYRDSSLIIRPSVPSPLLALLRISLAGSASRLICSKSLLPVAVSWFNPMPELEVSTAFSLIGDPFDEPGTMLIILSFPRIEVATNWALESVRISSEIALLSSSRTTFSVASIRSSLSPSGSMNFTSSTLPIETPASCTSAPGCRPSALTNLAFSRNFFSNGLKSPVEFRIKNPVSRSPESINMPTRSSLKVSFC